MALLAGARLALMCSTTPEHLGGREPSLFRYPKADEDKLIPRRRKMFGPARQGYIKDTDGENAGKGMEIENRF